MLLILGLEIINTKEIKFQCTCNKDKVKGILKGLDKKELKKYIVKSDEIEVACQYCAKKYNFIIDKI